MEEKPTKENYELYRAGYAAQAERIRELEREVRELKSALHVTNAALKLKVKPLGK